MSLSRMKFGGCTLQKLQQWCIKSRKMINRWRKLHLLVFYCISQRVPAQPSMVTLALLCKTGWTGRLLQHDCRVQPHCQNTREWGNQALEAKIFICHSADFFFFYYSPVISSFEKMPHSRPTIRGGHIWSQCCSCMPACTRLRRAQAQNSRAFEEGIWLVLQLFFLLLCLQTSWHTHTWHK